MAYLIDTCVLCELLKPQPSRAVVRWLDETEEQLLYLSVLSLGEIEKGIAKLAAGRKRRRLEEWLRMELASRFEGRLLSIELDVASEWGRLSGELERKGKTVPVLDALLAATALVNGLTVATRNTSDIARTGAKVLDPWT